MSLYGQDGSNLRSSWLSGPRSRPSTMHPKLDIGNLLMTLWCSSQCSLIWAKGS